MSPDISLSLVECRNCSACWARYPHIEGRTLNLFIRPDEPHVTVKHFVDHVDHIAGKFGIEHVGIGFDLCDSHDDNLTLGPVVDSYDVIDTHAGLAEFTAELLCRGYGDDDVLAVLGGNLARVYEQITG